MPKRSVGKSVESLVAGIVRAAVHDLRRVLPSEKRLGRIEGRLRGLDRGLRALARQARKAAARRGRGGRPRINPETCTMRACNAPARAKALCSRHYQQRRRQALRRQR
jgi:hypothetical protein